ncbi:hypothetical protein WICMUC_004064 [Wickerhamomyces mucosus]|uniref:Ubiquitin-like protease family profile domain-containing protein n=1 Tax=Wickerhamomyces mucosus TaxID=1378264 RepID=A0A9P8PIS1_9ASCO|nr:hypothetical protein WICMUC_004064 [Wickerhamomyces mucosus]
MAKNQRLRKGAIPFNTLHNIPSDATLLLSDDKRSKLKKFKNNGKENNDDDEYFKGEHEYHLEKIIGKTIKFNDNFKLPKNEFETEEVFSDEESNSLDINLRISINNYQENDDLDKVNFIEVPILELKVIDAISGGLKMIIDRKHQNISILRENEELVEFKTYNISKIDYLNSIIHIHMKNATKIDGNQNVMNFFLILDSSTTLSKLKIILLSISSKLKIAPNKLLNSNYNSSRNGRSSSSKQFNSLTRPTTTRSGRSTPTNAHRISVSDPQSNKQSSSTFYSAISNLTPSSNHSILNSDIAYSLPQTRSATKRFETHVDLTSPSIKRGRNRMIFTPSLKHKFKDGSVFEIKNSDYQCLYPTEWLNDTLIDFFVKYYAEEGIELYKQNEPQELNTPVQKGLSNDDFQILNSFFFTKLTSNKDQHYNNISRWISKMDLLKKKFLIIPINEGLHWYCTIIQNLDTLVTSDDNLNPEGKCQILVFDSLHQTHKDILKPFQEVIIGFAKDKYGVELQNSQIELDEVHVPKQNNSSDCGIHVIYTLSKFFQTPYNTLAYWLEDRTLKHIQRRKIFRLKEREEVRESLRKKLIAMQKEMAVENGEKNEDEFDEDDLIEVVSHESLNGLENQTGNDDFKNENKSPDEGELKKSEAESKDSKFLKNKETLKDQKSIERAVSKVNRISKTKSGELDLEKTESKLDSRSDFKEDEAEKDQNSGVDIQVRLTQESNSEVLNSSKKISNESSGDLDDDSSIIPATQEEEEDDESLKPQTENKVFLETSSIENNEETDVNKLKDDLEDISVHDTGSFVKLVENTETKSKDVDGDGDVNVEDSLVESNEVYENKNRIDIHEIYDEDKQKVGSHESNEQGSADDFEILEESRSATPISSKPKRYRTRSHQQTPTKPKSIDDKIQSELSFGKKTYDTSLILSDVDTNSTKSSIHIDLSGDDSSYKEGNLLGSDRVKTKSQLLISNSKRKINDRSSTRRITKEKSEEKDEDFELIEEVNYKPKGNKRSRKG